MNPRNGWPAAAIGDRRQRGIRVKKWYLATDRSRIYVEVGDGIRLVKGFIPKAEFQLSPLSEAALAAAQRVAERCGLTLPKGKAAGWECAPMQAMKG